VRVSGPVRTEDIPADDGATTGATAGPAPVDIPTLEVTPSREAQVGALRVRRALPRRTRRTVGPWCFVDHMGPVPVTEEHGVDIGPHPHIGLQTVTWLVAGEVLHRDGLGSEQLIRPGQLNLMTAGHGVAHAEEATGQYRGDMHGVQLWVAQPERTRHGPPAFEHHASLPQVELAAGVATVLVGSLPGLPESLSPARHDTGQVGVDLALRAGETVVPLDRSFEHALVVLDGAVSVGAPGAAVVEPGNLAYLGEGRDELPLSARADTRALLVGGEPFEAPVLMWWNFVARTRDEVTEARSAWEARDDRFAPVTSGLARIPAPPTPWG
jgi:redox-sensitive bicupin YhaK (pirin superfamily)